MKLILLGSTGLVGSHVLELATANPAVEAITAPQRKATVERAKVYSPIVDFENLPVDAEWWKADALICALGTTQAAAGSKEKFYRVDHDYPMMAARLALHSGTPTFVLNSAKGANTSSFVVYSRVKGALERDLSALGFRSLTFVRPALLAGKRNESRPMESFGLKLSSALGSFLPIGLRPNPAEHVARALLDSAISAQPGVHIIPSESLV